jgi:low temperature requirement protein LtrA
MSYFLPWEKAGTMAGSKRNLWWGPPRLFDERRQERKIGWLELFYDLAFVAAISQLTHQLSHHPSWPVAGFCFLLFSLVFWAWTNGSQYYDLHGSDGIRTRMLTFLQMLSIAGVAIAMPSAFAGRTRGLAIAFAFSQSIVAYLWWSVGFYDPSHRVFSKFFTVGYLIGLALLIASAFCGPRAATALWIAAACVDVSPPLIGWSTIVGVLRERGQVFSASASIVERFGLFTIIVLTESILGTVAGVTEAKHRSPAAWAAAVLALFLSFLLWSLYFDMTSEQETKPGYHNLQALIFLHFPLLAALSFIGACVKALLGRMGGRLPGDLPWLFCLALAVVPLSIVGLTRIMNEREEQRAYIRPIARVMVICAFALIGTAPFGRALGALGMLAVAVGILLVPVAIGVRAWVHSRFTLPGIPPREEEREHEREAERGASTVSAESEA